MVIIAILYSLLIGSHAHSLETILLRFAIFLPLIGVGVGSWFWFLAVYLDKRE